MCPKYNYLIMLAINLVLIICNSPLRRFCLIIVEYHIAIFGHSFLPSAGQLVFGIRFIIHFLCLLKFNFPLNTLTIYIHENMIFIESVLYGVLFYTISTRPTRPPPSQHRTKQVRYHRHHHWSSCANHQHLPTSRRCHHKSLTMSHLQSLCRLTSSPELATH